MYLEQQLTDAMRRVRAGLLKNEAQVKQSVILPILRALGWNTDAPEQLSAEFPAGDGRVDYALLHYDQPQVFIEAKRTRPWATGWRSRSTCRTVHGVGFLHRDIKRSNVFVRREDDSSVQLDSAPPARLGARPQVPQPDRGGLGLPLAAGSLP